MKEKKTTKNPNFHTEWVFFETWALERVRVYSTYKMTVQAVYY